VEVSLNVESELLIEFSFTWLAWIFIFIDDVPFLVDLSVFGPCNDVSVFSINSTMDIKYLTLLVDEMW
jgi:hypothetical protein